MAPGNSTSAQRDADAQEERALMRRDISDMKEDLAIVRAEVKGLVDMWKAASTLLVVVKWMAGVGASIGAIWAVVTNWPGK